MSRHWSVQQGFILPSVLGYLVVITIIFLAVIELIGNNIVLVGNTIQSQKAFNIAEAGINYYLWHLSHNATDYKDGKTTPVTPDPQLGYGPYTHNYIDDNAKTQGTFTLWINPQGSGSTVVKIRAIGQVAGTTIKRTIDAQIGAPSFASYGLVSDTAFWFGNTETANGPVHSNQGIRMDGPSTSDVTSTNAAYVPPTSLGGDGASHPGVWCHPSVTSPVNCNTRSKTDWRYPVPTVDFNAVNGSLCSMKKTAFSADVSTAALASSPTACSQVPTNRTAAYLPRRGTSFSTARGYLIQLNTNGTYNLSQVNAEDDRATPYTNALSLTTVQSNIPVPSSGVIFAEDNVWVRSNPTFHGRLTIASGRLASSSQSTNVTIADDLVYSTRNGSDAIGIVAEQDILIAPYAPPASGGFTFEVNAALIAQAGAVKYPDVYQSVETCTRGWTNNNQTFTFYGSIATRQSWTWTWLWGTSACGDNALDPATGNRISGVLHNTTQYDYNMLYNPPPSWPVTSSYNVLSWREVLTGP